MQVTRTAIVMVILLTLLCRCVAAVNDFASAATGTQRRYAVAYRCRHGVGGCLTATATMTMSLSFAGLMAPHIARGCLGVAGRCRIWLLVPRAGRAFAIPCRLRRMALFPAQIPKRTVSLHWRAVLYLRNRVGKKAVPATCRWQLHAQIRTYKLHNTNML